MKCCINCFNDYDLKGMISSRDKLGNCEICDSKDTFIYDTSIETYLNEPFDEIIDLYVNSQNFTGDHGVELKTIDKHLIEEWGLFSSSIDIDSLKVLIKEIFKKREEENLDFFSEIVGIKQLTDKDYIEKNSIVGASTWDSFVGVIKNKLRFHMKHLNKTVFEIICSYLVKDLKYGEKFYRGRISEKECYPKEKMGPPPSTKASEGRANPEGISYLYLGKDIETIVHEVRSKLYDYVSIGEFVLQEDIKIIDLTAMNNLSPFSGLGSMQYILNKKHLEKINEEIAKPLRRNDSKLDYLPTQYLCELIKLIEFEGNQKYEGIKFKSTLNPKGYNIVIFNEKLFECEKVFLYEVKEIEYKNLEDIQQNFES